MAKANGTLETLTGITRSTWGISLKGLQRIYQAMVVPQLLYTSALWYNYRDSTLKATTKNAIMAQFTKIQKRAGIIISRAYRAIAAKALNAKLFLLPMRQQLERQLNKIAIRILTGPAIGRPRKWDQPRDQKAIKLGGLTLTEIFIKALPKP